MAITKTKKAKPYISIILPVYNEEENIALQYQKIVESATTLKKSFEVIFVDDGSIDRSFSIIDAIAKKDKRIKLVRFRRNFGQTAAMAAGIDFASGEILIFMDSDLQNDPSDIQKIIDKINEGYDVVSGWRKARKDTMVTRKIPSKIANWLIAKVIGIPLHDLGCSLKGYRAEILKKVRLYGEMHRFIPIHASWVGAKITEIPVKHHPRIHGQSKYGLKRTFKIILDLMTVKFFSSYASKPIYLYGGVAMGVFFVSVASLAATILMKYYTHMNMTGNPLLLLSAILFLLSVILVLMGIQAEILIRIYHETEGKDPYYVRETRNL